MVGSPQSGPLGSRFGAGGDFRKLKNINGGFQKVGALFGSPYSKDHGMLEHILWRTAPGEVRGVGDFWSRRAPQN